MKKFLWKLLLMLVVLALFVGVFASCTKKEEVPTQTQVQTQTQVITDPGELLVPPPTNENPEGVIDFPILGLE